MALSSFVADFGCSSPCNQPLEALPGLEEASLLLSFHHIVLVMLSIQMGWFALIYGEDEDSSPQPQPLLGSSCRFPLSLIAMSNDNSTALIPTEEAPEIVKGLQVGMYCNLALATIIIYDTSEFSDAYVSY